MTEIKSRRGVYLDLSRSPYEYQTPYGDLFKFSSQKKLDMFTRDIEKELDRMEKLLIRHGMTDFLPKETQSDLYRAVYRSFYRKIMG